ncbi:hemolysin-III related-domain-containing protein [Auriculariales sp. MPI-PUGE-AT-0066]|nr:hemolysin-III related-domain-containing protein [Auriculariales sp. MPI-PUGE-AT-0066]
MASATSEPALRRRRGSSPPSAGSSNTVMNTAKSIEKRLNPPSSGRGTSSQTGVATTPSSRQATAQQSVNIWSHLLGSLVFSGLGFITYWLYESAIKPRYTSATGADVLAFGCFFVGAFVCLGMSATYHALTNHSPEVARWGNKLDYSGIVFLIVGSYMPALYYGFNCLPGLMRIYLSMVNLASGGGCLVVSWFEHFRTSQWRPYRAMMFVSLGLSGVVPVLHGLTIYGYQSLNERMGLNWVILQGVLYILGAAIYAARWPERSRSSKFDIWGSSHQIFHILILFAAASHLYGMAKAFDYHHGSLGAKC